MVLTKTNTPKDKSVGSVVTLFVKDLQFIDSIEAKRTGEASWVIYILVKLDEDYENDASVHAAAAKLKDHLTERFPEKLLDVRVKTCQRKPRPEHQPIKTWFSQNAEYYCELFED